MRQSSTVQRAAERVRELTSQFDSYVDAFERVGLFTGPSLYFHYKTLERLRQHPTVIDAIRDSTFRESLYATLTSWGHPPDGSGQYALGGLFDL